MMDQALPSAGMTPFESWRMGPLTLRNRFIKAAANEAMSADGMPTPQLLAHHQQLARGGVALTTMAYLAISPEGRTLPNQLWLRAESVPALRAITDAVHAQGAAIAGQITHGGSFVTGLKLAKPARTSSGGLNKAGLLAGNFWQRAMNEADMAEICGQFARAATLCAQAGFDAVELHLGHGYLLNQFISPLSNKRRDAYGGDIHGRMRFPLRVLRAVRDVLPPHMALMCKINAADGVAGGSDAQDAAQAARLLEQAGADLLVLSSGRNMESVWYMFGSPMNQKALAAALKDDWLQRQALRLASLAVPKDLRFQELYRLAEARVVRQATSMKLAYLGGASSLENAQSLLAEGFDAIAMARPLLHDPDLINKFQAGTATRSGCTHCNACVATIYSPGGTMCRVQAQ